MNYDGSEFDDASDFDEPMPLWWWAVAATIAVVIYFLARS